MVSTLVRNERDVGLIQALRHNISHFHHAMTRTCKLSEVALVHTEILPLSYCHTVTLSHCQTACGEYLSVLSVTAACVATRLEVS